MTLRHHLCFSLARSAKPLSPEPKEPRYAYIYLCKCMHIFVVVDLVMCVKLCFMFAQCLVHEELEENGAMKWNCGSC